MSAESTAALLELTITLLPLVHIHIAPDIEQASHHFWQKTYQLNMPAASRQVSTADACMPVKVYAQSHVVGTASAPAVQTQKMLDQTA